MFDRLKVNILFNRLFKRPNINKAYASYLNKCKKNGIKVRLNEIDFIKLDNIVDLVSCSFLPVGHGVAIKALLEKDIEVIDGKVIDHIGLLK